MDIDMIADIKIKLQERMIMLGVNKLGKTLLLRVHQKCKNLTCGVCA
jgi:hypothetical protein